MNQQYCMLIAEAVHNHLSDGNTKQHKYVKITITSV